VNVFGFISGYFIKNKKLSLLILIGILLWGGISFWIMPKQYNPDIVAPAFSIVVDFPNATVDEVYHLVTKPLEDVLNEIPGVENIYSKSIHGGRSYVVTEFFVGEDLEESMIILRQKISSRLNLAPLGIKEPFIVSIDPEDLPIKTLALFSNKKDAISIRKIAFQLKEEIRNIDGISYVEVIGGRNRQLQIVLDPEKMMQSKTSLNEIEQALSDTSLLKDFGFIKTEDKYFPIETQEQAKTVEDIKNLVITSNFEQNLRVGDVAQVIEGEREYEDYVNYYKKDSSINNAVYIAISKQKGQNIINVSKKVDEKIAELKMRKSYLDGVTIDIVKDEGRIANEEISGLILNLVQAVCIVFIVLLCFLNYRAAMIVAFSIPITLLTVLALGNLFGYTINRITLFALILSLGLLVDSATVVIENIVRNKKKVDGSCNEGLIVRSVSEVGAGLFLSTLTTVLAFIPMVFVTGMMGPYMGPIPFFVSCALIVSLIFAYTLNPWLAFIFCRENVESNIEKNCGVICNISKAVLFGYKKFLSLLLGKRKARLTFLFICFVVLLIVMVFPVIKLLRFRMLPKADREQVYVYVDLNRGSSVENTYKVSKRLVDILRKNKDVKSIQSFVGIPPVLDFNGLFRGVSDRNSSNQITLKLNLTSANKRKVPSEDLAVKYRTLLLNYLKLYPDIKLKIVEDPPGPPVRSTFFIKIKSDNAEVLYSAAEEIKKKVNLISQVEDVDVSNLEQNDKYVLFVDKEAAAKAKVSVGSISKELETIFGGRVIGVYHSDYNLEQEYIVLKLRRTGI